MLVVKGEDQFVVHQHVLPARLVFQVFHLPDQFLVRCQKRQLGFPLAIDQGLADEDLARGVRVDAAKVDPPPAVDHDAVQCGALQRHHFRRFFLPVRIQQLFL